MIRSTVFPVLFVIIFSFSVSADTPQQPPKWDDPQSLPQWMTPEEKLRVHEIGQGFVKTPAPLSPVRSIAEFERLEGVLIRYPLGIPLALVADMSQHAKVYTIVGSNWQRNQAINAYTNAGANMSNCEFIIAATNSYWTRDYGPWFIADGNDQVAIVDFPYNRPRPSDNAIPGVMANYLNLPMYGMDVIHTGGNYMSVGLGQAASTDLVYSENQNNQTFVNGQMEDYLGIDTYHVTIDAPGSYIEHIDTWAKFLDVDKILIGQVHPSHSRYWAYEQVADYFAGQISPYGTPYEVIRVYTPNGEPYTNSLILNERVYVPITGSSWDGNALQTYADAMPGYEILGFHGSWESTDALHCRVKDMADPGMLYIEHFPIHGEHEFQPEFEITADIIPYSGAQLITDQLFVHYQANEEQFETIPLIHEAGHTFSASIPVTTSDTLITYYLSAADASGRNETWPLIGAPGARSFTILPPEDLHYKVQYSIVRSSGTLTAQVGNDFIESGEYVMEGNDVLFEATPAGGFEIKEWTLNGNVILAQGRNTSKDDVYTGGTFLYTSLDQDIDVTVAFQEIPPQEFILTVNITGEGTILVNDSPYTGPLTFEEGTVVQLEALADHGWVFETWSGDLEDNHSLVYVTIDGDTEITANFNLEEITISATVHPTDAGTISGAGVYVFGEDITLTAFANQGYQFLHWMENDEVVYDGSETAGEDYTFQASVDRHIEAHFEAIMPTVTFDITNGDGGLVSNAVITLGNMANEPGDYIFHDVSPGTHSFNIEAECLKNQNGQIVVSFENKDVSVILNHLMGDANDDGIINLLDVITMVMYFENQNPVPFCFNNADINHDGSIDLLDIIETVGIFQAAD